MSVSTYGLVLMSAIVPYQRFPTAPCPSLSPSLRHVASESGVSLVHILGIWRDILGTRLLAVDQA